MFDEKNHDRTDSLGARMTRLGEQMTPSPQLMQAAATGTPLHEGGVKYTAGTHVKQTAKAILLYAACVALFLGAVMLLPRWFDTQPPIATQPPATTTTPPVTDERDKLTDPDALTPIQLEITKATWEKYKNMVTSDYTIDFVASHVTKTFLHPCGDGYALFMCDFRPTGQMFTRVLLGDYEFRYGNTDTLDYYEDGKFYELGDAYAAKLFTDDDLRGVWEAYKVRCAGSYTPEADAEWKDLGWLESNYDPFQRD